MNLRNSALVLIDLQEDFFEHGYPRKTRTQLCSSINQLSEIFRTQELPVIWVRQEYSKDFNDAPPRLKQQGSKITVEGDSGSQILSELNVETDDIQIVKKRFSAFFQTELNTILQNLKVNTIVIAGANTHACVLSTVQDAYNRDYQLILVPQAVQSHDPFLHNQAWALMTRYMAQEVSLKQLEGLGSTQYHIKVDDLVSSELRDKGKKDQIAEGQHGKAEHQAIENLSENPELQATDNQSENANHPSYTNHSKITTEEKSEKFTTSTDDSKLQRKADSIEPQRYTDNELTPQHHTTGSLGKADHPTQDNPTMPSQPDHNYPTPHKPVKPSQPSHKNPEHLLKPAPPKDKAQTSASQNHTILPAGVEDAQTIYNLINELSEFEKLAHAMKSSPDSIIKNMQRGLIHCLLCKVEGEIVGFALYFFNYSTFEGRPGLYLEDLYVKPQFRSQGLGKALLLNLMSIAKSMDCARMEWVVLDWNQSARDFYKSLGAIEMTDWVLTRMTDEAIEQCISRHSDETSPEPEESSNEE